MASGVGRVGRWLARTALVLLVALVLAVAIALYAGWHSVYHSHSDPLASSQADALMVLGPLDDWRVADAEKLMAQGVAKNLVFSTPTLPSDLDNCRGAHLAHPWKLYCFAPNPSTTRGEAIGLERLAREHGWKNVVVLTIDFHAARARFIFGRCLGHAVPVLGVHRPYEEVQYHGQVVYQAAGYVKEVLLGTCPA